MGGGGETEDGTIHACMHACIHTYMQYINAYIHTCMHAYMHACMHTYIQNIQTPCFAVPRKVSAEAEVQRLPGAFRNECRGIRKSFD